MLVLVRGRGDLVSDRPRQQLVNAADGVVRDALQHVAQVVLRVDAVELGRAEQRVDRRGALAAAIGALGALVLAAAYRALTFQKLKELCLWCLLMDYPQQVQQLFCQEKKLNIRLKF